MNKPQLSVKHPIITRLLIAIIIAFFAFLAEFRQWLIYEPYTITFKIKCGNTINYYARVYEKDGQENHHKETQETSEKEYTYVVFNINHVKSPQSFELLLKDITKPTVIYDLKIMNKQLNKNDLKKLKVKGANAKIVDNKVIIFPIDKKIQITSYNVQRAKRGIKITYKQLYYPLLLFIFFLFFNIELKNKEKSDILLFMLFISIIFLPLTKINHKEYSEIENRHLEQLEPFIQDNKFNTNFTKHIERWYSDRLYLRDFLTKINNSIYILLDSKTNNGILDNKKHFTYMKSHIKTIQISYIEKKFKSLYEFNDFCKQNNIKLYILIVPSKLDIYETDNLNKIYSEKNFKKELSDFVKFIKYTNNKNILKVIYPYEALQKEADKELVFFRNDHHWTDDGAYIGYKELMKEINKDYPDIKVLNSDDFYYFYDNNVRSEWQRKFIPNPECRRLNLAYFICKTQDYEYQYYRHKNFNSLNTRYIDKEHHSEKIYYYPEGSDYKVILYGTSQNENLTEFIPFTFKHVKRIRNYGMNQLNEGEQFKIMKYSKQAILDYKPDILILCITYHNLRYINKIFDKE